MAKIKFKVKIKRFKPRLNTPAPKIETPKNIYNRRRSKNIVREIIYGK